MSYMNKKTIESYFRKIEKEGWRFYRREKEDHTWWCASYETRGIKREVYLVLDSQWVYFQMPLHLNVGPPCKLAIYYYLLRLNDKIFNAKFSIDQENKILLMAEFPVRNFDFTMFYDILKTLVTLARKYCRELEILAEDTKIANLVGDQNLAPEPGV